MSRNRRRSRKRGGSYSRRRFQLLLLAGATTLGSFAAAARETGAFTSIVGDRTSIMQVAPEGEGIIGIVPQNSVQFKQRDPLVELTNNIAEAVTVTITLNKGSDGTLYDNDGDSGDSVSFTLLAGKSQWVDLKADATGTIGYSISVSSPNLSFSTTESVESVTGRKAGAVDIRSPHSDNHFTTDVSRNRWEISNIDVRDNDGDNDLDRIEMTIREGGSAGVTVATETISIPGGSSDRYAPSGTPDARIKPDDNSYSVKTNTLYNLEFLAYDADENFAAESLDDQT